MRSYHPMKPHNRPSWGKLGEAMGSWETCDDGWTSTAKVQLKWCETSAPGKNLSSTDSVIEEFGLPNAWNWGSRSLTWRFKDNGAVHPRGVFGWPGQPKPLSDHRLIRWSQQGKQDKISPEYKIFSGNPITKLVSGFVPRLLDTSWKNYPSKKKMNPRNCFSNLLPLSPGAARSFCRVAIAQCHPVHPLGEQLQCDDAGSSFGDAESARLWQAGEIVEPLCDLTDWQRLWMVLKIDIYIYTHTHFFW